MEYVKKNFIRDENEQHFRVKEGFYHKFTNHADSQICMHANLRDKMGARIYANLGFEIFTWVGRPQYRTFSFPVKSFKCG